MDLLYCKGGRQGPAYFAADRFGLPSSEPSRWFALAHENVMKSDPNRLWAGSAALQEERRPLIV